MQPARRAGLQLERTDFRKVRSFEEGGFVGVAFSRTLVYYDDG